MKSLVSELHFLISLTTPGRARININKYIRRFTIEDILLSFRECSKYSPGMPDGRDQANTHVTPNGSVAVTPTRESLGLDELLDRARATASRLIFDGKERRTDEFLEEELDASTRSLNPNADCSTTRLPEFACRAWSADL